jgi:hypothetical protein
MSVRATSDLMGPDPVACLVSKAGTTSGPAV